jgi:integrase/recombinase XerD
MSSTAVLLPAGELVSRPDPLRLAAASYLARFTGPSRMHTESDQRIYLDWCGERVSTPLTVEFFMVDER